MKPDVDDFPDSIFALSDPKLAAERFQRHILNWEADLVNRRDFYAGVVETALLTLPPEDANMLRRTWDGITQYMNAQTDAEKVAIDEWLKLLTEAKLSSGQRSYMDFLQDCERGYFTPAIDAEMDQLVSVPGFDEAFERLEWPS